MSVNDEGGSGSDSNPYCDPYHDIKCNLDCNRYHDHVCVRNHAGDRDRDNYGNRDRDCSHDHGPNCYRDRDQP